MSASPRLELVDVAKAFHEGRSNELWAVQGVDLVLEGGGVSALSGPSGSGKTTLLTLIGCLARPTRGRVRLDGEPVSGLPERFLTDLRRRRFGFVFQQFNLIAGLTALENVVLPAVPLGEVRGVVLERANALLERLQVAHRRDTRVEWLSGGERQRIAIARALVNGPDVLIADEPTANLDTHLSRAFLEIVADLNARGTTVVLSSHDPRVLESGGVHRIISMRDGRVLPGPEVA